MGTEFDVQDEQEEQLGELNLPLPQNHSPLPRFANLHLFFTKLASVHGEGSIERRHQVVVKFLEVWRMRVGDDIYPAVRLWFPEEDEQLKQLRRIKDTMIAKMLVEALDLPAKSPDAINLMDIRKGAYNYKRNGDDDGLPGKAKHAIQQRYAQSDYSDWRVDEVAAKLVKFAESRKSDRVAILKEMINSMKAEEIYWVIKIMMGNLSINCSVRTFLSILHPDALKVYLVNKNLQMVCKQLWSADFQVSEVDKYVHLLSHFCPMRAKFVKGAADHLDSVAEIMRAPTAESNPVPAKRNRRGGPVTHNHTDLKKPVSFFLEEKVDGERIQLHWIRNPDTVSIFSRNGKDHTLAFQSIFRDQSVEIYYEGQTHKSDNPEDNPYVEPRTAEPHTPPSSGGNSKSDAAMTGDSHSFSMQDIVEDDVDSCIIDGEVVAWDPQTDDICGQSKVRELTAHHKGARYRHMLLVFDVVYVNGNVLTEKPLKERKEELQKLLPERKRSAGNGRIQILPYKIGRTTADISTEFNRVLGHMSEGLVVKNPEGVYEIDGRSNSWIKLKPEFVDGYQGENLDLSIVGCYYGSGKHKDRFGSYLCALKDETQKKRFVALSRVGSGICLAMYDYINEKISTHIFAQKSPPAWLALGGERAPDFYIDPDVSIIFEVKYSMISSVTADKARGRLGYGVGFSLRFPRYVKLREDKDVKSSLTIGEFLELQSSHPDVKSDGKTPNLRGNRDRGARPPKQAKIRDEVFNNDVDQQSDVFKGSTFYICGDICNPRFMTAFELSTLIQGNGGSITSIMSPGVIPIADSNLPNTVKLLGSGISVIHPRYLFDCLENQRMLDFEPNHYYGTPPPVSSGHETVDKFGFALYRHNSKPEVKELFDAIDNRNLHYKDADLQNALQQLLVFTDDANTSVPQLRSFLFTGLSVYIDCSASEDGGLSLTRSKLQYGSAVLVKNIKDATHILRSKLHPKSEESFVGNNYVPQMNITKNWIDECWRTKKLAPDIKLESNDT